MCVKDQIRSKMQHEYASYHKFAFDGTQRSNRIRIVDRMLIALIDDRRIFHSCLV